MSDIADAVAGVTADLFGGGGDEAQPEPVASSETDAAAPPAHDAAPTEQPEVEIPSLDYELPDEYKELLDEPDFDAEASEDLADEDEELAVSEYDDEQTAKLKKQLLAERKKAEHYARLRAQDNQKRWQTEADRVFKGLAGDLSDVKATSHRAFLREAKRRADANQRILAPHIEALNKARESLTGQVRQEVRQEAAAAWGKPTVGGGQVPATPAPAEAEARLERGRQRRSMVDIAKALIDKQEI